MYSIDCATPASIKEQSLPAAYTFVSRPECPVCEGKDRELLYRCRFDEGAIGKAIRQHYAIDPAIFGTNAYELVSCRSCSLVYQSSVGDSRLLDHLYCDWVKDHARPADDPVYQRNVQRPRTSRDGHELMVAARYLKIPLGELRTLDFGMGWALWARIAEQLGCRSHGAELAPERIDYARQHGVATVELDELPDNQFHFINTEQVFEHLTHPLSVGSKLASALSPGGILKLSVPLGSNARALAHRLQTDNASVDFDMMMPIAPLEHVNTFNPRAIAMFAARLGLRIARPSWLTRYAFVTDAGAFDLSRPLSVAKELVRPLWHVLSRRNLYVWLQKPGSPTSGVRPHG